MVLHSRARVAPPSSPGVSGTSEAHGGLTAGAGLGNAGGRGKVAAIEPPASLLEILPAAVYTVDREGRITYFNRKAAELWGREPRLLDLDQRFCGAFRLWRSDGTELAHADTPMAQALRGAGGVRDMEVVIEHPGGRRGPVRVHVDPLLDERGEIRGAVNVFFDSTEREAVEAASRAKDEFLALLSHELKNPLAPILTALHLMKLRGDPGAAKELGVIERQVQHVNRLVDDLLDVSRIIRGGIELRCERVRVAEVVAQAIEMASSLIEHRGHRLEVELPGEEVEVEADRTRLAQVVANLLTNAAKYTPPVGRITVTARVEGGELTVSVRDDGLGIPPGKLARIWDPFYQLGRSVERAQGGLGLGLTIVKSIAELHGGRVDARSEGSGRGSEFTVTIPRISSVHAAVPAPVPPEDSVPVSSALARRVLIVDDNCDSADMLAEYLRDSGHEVQVAYDPAQALAAAGQFRFDVALLDIGLPVMDGYELARRLRVELDGRPARFFAFTGYGQETARRQSLDAGFDDHFTKPLDPGVIAKLLLATPAAR